jgi:hypothetical protein
MELAMPFAYRKARAGERTQIGRLATLSVHGLMPSRLLRQA